MAEANLDDFFDAAFLARLARLRLAVRRQLLGGGSGRSVPGARGGRSEFREHRDYVPGDETRYIDWNVYARLDHLCVKEFTSEAEITVSILLDATPSMRIGSPSKLDFGRRLSAALAYLALLSKSQVRFEVQTNGSRRVSPPFASMASFRDILRFVSDGSARQRDRVAAPLRGSRSVVYLVTDGFDLADLAVRLAHLDRRGADVALLHVLAAQDLDPPFDGRLRLHDAETNEVRELSVGPTELHQYHRALEEFLMRCQSMAMRHHASYFLFSSVDPLEQAILDVLLRGGLLVERR